MTTTTTTHHEVTPVSPPKEEPHHDISTTTTTTTNHHHESTPVSPQKEEPHHDISTTTTTTTTHHEATPVSPPQDEKTCTKTTTIDVPLPTDFNIDTSQTRITIEDNGKQTSHDGNIEVEVTSDKQCSTDHSQTSTTSSTSSPSADSSTAQVPAKKCFVDGKEVECSHAPAPSTKPSTSEVTKIVKNSSSISEKPKINSTPVEIKSETHSNIERTPTKEDKHNDPRNNWKVCKKEQTIDIPVETDIEVKEGGSFTVTPGTKQLLGKSGFEAEVFEDKSFENIKIQKLNKQRDSKLKSAHREKEVRINKLTLEHVVERLGRLVEREEKEVSRLRSKAVQLRGVLTNCQSTSCKTRTYKAINKLERAVDREDRQVLKFKQLKAKFAALDCSAVDCHARTHFLNEVESKLKALERANAVDSRNSLKKRKSLEKLCKREFGRSASQHRPVHIKQASHAGRRLQALPPTAADIGLVKTFQEHITTFRPADRALINNCLA